MTKDLTVLILAGGAGKRLWPIEQTKSLLSFIGQPLLVHNVKGLRKAGFRRFIIVVNPKDAPNISQIMGRDNIVVRTQKQPLGMGDAVLAAKNDLVGKALLVMNAEDVVEEWLYRQLYEEVQKGSSFLVGKTVNQYFDGGYLSVQNKRVVDIVEKPGEGKEPSNLVNLVFHFFSDPSAFLMMLAKSTSERDDVYERALAKVLAKGEFRVLPYDGFWQPLKYPWHVLAVLDYFLKRLKPYQGKNVEIKDYVVIEGAVHLGDNVRIFENTKIVGPCYIGPNTVIGNNNIIRESHIGGNCVTGFNTDITRSYIGDNSWFHSNYVGDSVLEGNISLGSGAVLANLRLDEGEVRSTVKGERINTGRHKLGAIIGRDVRIGVNASIMPGIKIGRGSFVGAGVVLDRDLPEESFCVAQAGLTVKKNTRQIPPQARTEFRQKI